MDPDTLQNNINAVTPGGAITPNNPTSVANSLKPVQPKPQKSKALITTSIICAVLAIAGIGFGVYGMLTANQKSAEISDLKTDIESKTTEVIELEAAVKDLEAMISDLNLDEETAEVADPETIEGREAASEVGQKESAETASIILGAVLDENETRKVFEIGSCTADGPSVKCRVNTTNGESLISYNSNDNILRLSIPSN